MDIRQGIIDAATALGISPNHLATIISYETGGTFDPLQKGPTTRYGQHMGLIQFGGPQRQKYGVDLSSPEAALNSQLGANGAIVRYLKDAGVKPGTDLVNLYSAVNAGTVGQTGAVDRGTTVSQKVAGMRDHETKAASLLGGQWTPPAGSAVAAAPALYEPQPSEDRNAEFEALLASRPEAARDAAPRSLLADTMASSVGRRSSGGGGLTPTVADQNAAVPIADLAPAAAPEAAPITDSPIAATPLAELFKIKDIGMASATDPLTGAPRLLRTRRAYG